jgi:sialate O-acetylesterase
VTRFILIASIGLILSAAFLRAEPQPMPAAPTAATSSLWLPAVFGDHMVLQRDKPITLWGKALASSSVEVFVDDVSKAKVDVDRLGNFRLALPAMPAGGPHALRIVAGAESRVFADVLVGEVWVASGQSNMEWTIKNSSTPAAYIQEAQNRPAIRLFNVSTKKRPATQPMSDVEAAWQVCSSESAPGFSAVAYHFGVKLQDELGGVPIGLINASWGGMPAEAFTPNEALQFDAMKPTLEDWDRRLSRYDELQKKFESDLAAWEALEEPTRKATTKPAAPAGPMSPNRPGNLWNGMIHPLVPYTMRGFIWYQGESNANRAGQYVPLLSAMIASWREAWGAPDAPFLIVQLANYRAPNPEPVPQSEWADLRAAQRVVAKEPGNGMAVIIDIGEEKDIHPRNKHDVGRRLALLALRDTYGKADLVAEGPTPSGWKVEGNQVVISFDHTGGGLVAKDGKLESFAIAAADGDWVWADARIVGDTVVLSSETVAVPARVRYAWSNNPRATLFNRQGLPAGPFELK